MSKKQGAAAVLKPFSRRRAAHLRRGRYGEGLACTLLRELGLDLLARSYRGRSGEIDIIAREDETICFVEVKTRSRVVKSRPADAVGTRKRRNIHRTAQRYLRELGNQKVRFRFDIVEVVITSRRLVDVRYWRHAFTVGEPRGGMRFPHAREGT